MKAFNFLFAFILLGCVVLFSTSCKKKRCQDKEVGSIDLSEEAKAYLTYEAGETIIFQNTDSDQLIFETEVHNEPYYICTKYLCELSTGPFETTPCENYSTMGIRHLLKQTNNNEPEGDIFINLSVGPVNYEEESKLFYDLFIVTMSGIGGLARGESVPHVHFDNPVFESENSEMMEPFTSVETIDVNGETYENMLLSTHGPNMIYYQIKEGIKIIKLDNSYYKLVE